jgi:hypothetical protein
MRAFVRSLTVMLAAGYCVASADAQTAPNGQKRVIPLPDTLGANFSVADSARATTTPSDYDFLIGAWRFRFQERNDDGSYQPPFEGLWVFEKKGAPNALIEDRWRADSPGSTLESGTYTYRSYNPQRKIWDMLGYSTREGEWAPGLMWADSANRYLIQHYGFGLMRIRYFAIQPNHFLWRADMSLDNGKTWRLDHWIMEANRIAK